jgi:hypothetical protein
MYESIDERIKNDFLGFRVMIWILVGLVSVICLPVFFAELLIVEGFLIMAGFFAFSIKKFSSRPYSATLVIFFLPVTALIALVVALANEQKYKEYRTAFNYVFTKCRN